MATRESYLNMLPTGIRMPLRKLLNSGAELNNRINLSKAETSGIVMSGAMTTGITLSGAMTTGLTISGACTDGILISGACSDNAIEVTGVCSDSVLRFDTGKIYANQYDQSSTILKIHNHDNTAEIGAAVFKGEFKNTTGLCLGQANYWSYEPTGDTGTPTQLSASENVVAVDTGMTVTAGNLYGCTGQVQLYGTLNGATVNVAGVIGVIAGNSTPNTQVLHMAGVQSAMSTGMINPTTGTLSYFLANSLTTVVVDNLLCMQASQYITNFASFNSATSGKCVEASANTPSGNATHAVRILVAGTPAYIPAYAASSF